MLIKTLEDIEAVIYAHQDGEGPDGGGRGVGTVTTEADPIVQENKLFDDDLIVDTGGGQGEPDSIGAHVINGSTNVGSEGSGPAATLTQKVEAKAGSGSATAGDGISDVFDDAEVGDDFSMFGDADASAEATAVANLLEQDLETGFNDQENDVDFDLVGGDETIYGVGGDDEDGETALDSQDQGATNTDLDVSQKNELSDRDLVQKPVVINNGTVNQDVDAIGGKATAGDGIVDFGGQGNNSSNVNVDDNTEIDGSTSASADALAVGDLIVQDIDTGGNDQENTVDFDIVGADKNQATVGDDALQKLSIVSQGNGSAVTNYGSTQLNSMVDTDRVTDPEVRNTYDAGAGPDDDNFPPGDPNDAAQNILADGGDATAGDGLSVEQSTLDIINGVGDAVSLSGDSSASADARADGDLITQDIDTGGNRQVNDVTGSTVGGNENGADVGGDANDLGIASFDTTAESSTTNDFAIDQTNNLNAAKIPGGPNQDAKGDSDLIDNPVVVNEESDINNEAGQLIQAKGGNAGASSGEGIDASGLDDIDTDGDISLDGSTSATADARADGELITQDLTTGRNVQANLVDLSTVGADFSHETVGEDDNSPVVLASGAEGTADSKFDVDQANNMIDEDEILQPQVRNQGDSLQKVTADGGKAVSEDGIHDLGQAAGNGLFDSGDNTSIVGSTSSSADATAVAQLITQELETGRNVQLNSVEADVVGGNKNTSDVGDDETNSANSLPQTGEGSAHTFFGVPEVVIPGQGDDPEVVEEEGPIVQHNFLNDVDLVDDPLVSNSGNANPDNLSQEADASQEVIANGGDADADDGIEFDGTSTTELKIVAGDSISIEGTSTATADALAIGDMITQDIETGRNGQANVFDASVVGSDQTLFNVGDDGYLSTAWTADDDPTDDTTTTVLLEQSNELLDGDTIDNPRVINDETNPNTEANFPVTQKVTATGGNAGAEGEDGVDLDGGGHDVELQSGDDASVSGSVSASADAAASGELITQELTTGRNSQTNDAETSIVGVNETVIEMGGDETSTFNAGAFEDVANGPENFQTDQRFEISQINEMMESDTINNPLVVNDGLVEQTIKAEGGDAKTQDGIEGNGGGFIDADAIANGFKIGDDLSIFGSSSASVDALAIGDLVTQNISTGANFQGNGVVIDLVGGSSSTAMIGEDNEG
ncbi:MAG: hypothetical protein QNJ92_09165 [Alphaproteobacteria bacterium]|nr:hypothetical protein [Alphaproteobacteria bacterium]